MRRLIQNYSKVNPSSLNLIAAEFFIQLINQTFLQILMIYMSKKGYHDALSADFFSYRFLGILLLSLPLGYFIRGKRLKPMFYMASLLTPLLSIFIVLAVDTHQVAWLGILQLAWGISYTCMHAFVIPFLLRNSGNHGSMEAISLVYAMSSLAGITGGLLVYALTKAAPGVFDEKAILLLISGLGFISFIFVCRIQTDETGTEHNSSPPSLTFGDMTMLARAIFPSFLLAIGAGLTIPFVGLFFFHIHGLDSDGFALLSAFTTLIVFFSYLIVPRIKERFGAGKGVLVSQGIGVFFLVNLALTEMYAAATAAVFIAGACYIIRRPLMLMAAPMTTEAAMQYVGEKNREMMSALKAANWSGSWFVSSKIFFYLRRAEMDYINIFLITAAIYIVSMISFYFVFVKPKQAVSQNKLNWSSK